MGNQYDTARNLRDEDVFALMEEAGTQYRAYLEISQISSIAAMDDRLNVGASSFGAPLTLTAWDDLGE